jgi:hypothetical protein
VKKTDLISAFQRGAGSVGGDSENGGLTAFAAATGFVWFVNHDSSGSTLFYRNNNSGNIDDLVHCRRARRRRDERTGNFVVYTADQVVYLKSLGREVALPGAAAPRLQPPLGLRDLGAALRRLGVVLGLG